MARRSESLSSSSAVPTWTSSGGSPASEANSGDASETTPGSARGSPPVGHVGQVSDIIDAIVVLESSPFITGEILHVDGSQIAGH